MTARLLALSLVLAAMGAIGWYIDDAAYSRGVRETQEEVQKAAIEATKQNDAVHREQIQTLLEAKDAEQKYLQVVSADHDRAVAELARLREFTHNTSGGSLPSADSIAYSHNANSAADLLGACGAELIDMARAADGHAADALMCTAAWPR